MSMRNDREIDDKIFRNINRSRDENYPEFNMKTEETTPN